MNVYRDSDIHRPEIKVVSIENTHNRGGGSVYTIDAIKKISEFCNNHSWMLHLDGARIFNALRVTKETPRQYGEVFDSM